MNKKVIDFNEALARAQQEEHQHECPHCEHINDIAANFLQNIDGMKPDSSEFYEEVTDLIRFVEFVTKRNTLDDLAGNLIDIVEAMDSDSE